ncbi:LAFA_0D02212g1_1 [Lachancea sp. 'fantastica']|nr:LAFA_0D02212g1_1 [Lachancea sp. 'fantastica']
MIADRHVLEAFDEIERNLEVSLQQSALAHQDQAPSSRKYQLQVLQDQLWLVQNEVAQLKDSLSNGKTPRSVNFPALERVLLKLQEHNEDTPSDFVAVSSDVEGSVRTAIDQYISVCLYYYVVQKSLQELPVISDTARYFGDVHDGTRWSLLYALQVLPKRLSGFIRRAYENGSARDLKLMGQRCSEYVLRQADRMVVVHSFQLVGLPKDPRKIARSILALPLAAVREEVQRKHTAADELFNDTTRKLGSLIGQFPHTSDMDERTKLLASFLGYSQKIGPENTPNGSEKVMLSIIPKATAAFETARYTKKPGFWTRYWPAFFAVFAYGPASAIALWKSRYKIARFCQENVVDFCAGLVHNWIWEPLKQVWSTVRHDEKNSTIAIASKGSLDSEFSSLTRMVVQLVAENSHESVDSNALVAQVQAGNLTEFMQIYEHQLHHPIKNILSGKLVRSLLIQIQKTKVDGSLALSGIDQLLQSQQLVFGVVAMSPAVLIMYALWTFTYRLAKLGRVWSNAAQFRLRLSSSLNNIERLLNYNEYDVNVTDRDLNTGLLALELVSARRYGDRLVPKNRRTEWIRDVGELVDTNLSPAARLNVVNRIYHVYGRFLT